MNSRQLKINPCLFSSHLLTILFALLFMLFTASCSGEPETQHQFPIHYGDQLTNTIAKGQKHGYKFLGNEGDVVEIQLTPQDDAGDYEFKFELYFDNGKVDLQDVDYGEQFEKLTLGKNGSYNIVVISVDGMMSVGDPYSGEYTIALRLISSRPATLATINPSQPDAEVEIGEITVLSEEIEQIINIQTVELPNCMGNQPLTQAVTISHTTEKKITFSPGAELEFDLGPARLAIQAQLSIEEGTIITQTQEVTLSASASTKVIYEVAWIEKSQHGLVEVISGSNVSYLEFAVNNVLEAKVQSSRDEPCPVTE